ncbi:MAG: hypothetical protein AAB657_00930, partial [Patescibacteria group bacterium]
MKATFNILFFVVSLLCSSILVFAQCPNENVQAIAGAPAGQYKPAAITNDDGSVIFTWVRCDNTDGCKIYAQKFSANGNAMWLNKGIIIADVDLVYEQAHPSMVSDGAGGAIIAWRDYRNGGGYSDIYSQRVDSNGIVQWGQGILTLNKAINNSRISMVSDGAGGVIVVENVCSSQCDNIYAQKINLTGELLWDSAGVKICDTIYSQWRQQIVSDGEGGAIIVWQDDRNGNNYDIYAQRVDVNGNALWQNNGIVVSSVPQWQSEPNMVSDGSGGAIIVWQDNRNGNSDIYAQRVDASG